MPSSRINQRLQQIKTAVKFNISPANDKEKFGVCLFTATMYQNNEKMVIRK